MKKKSLFDRAFPPKSLRYRAYVRTLAVLVSFTWPAFIVFGSVKETIKEWPTRDELADFYNGIWYSIKSGEF